MFMKMAQQVVSGLKVQHIVFKNPISSGWQNTKNLLYVCEIIFIVLCVFDAQYDEYMRNTRGIVEWDRK